MDINYLLLLQEFRNQTGNLFTPFMEWISHFAVAFLIIIPVFIYWCVDKKKGLYTFLAMALSIPLNSLIKVTACINRPWIRDPRITPVEGALKEATGYSFPSGHSVTAAAIYGAVAVSFRKKAVVIVSVILIILTCFSRNYLGVHTPQDVIVGLLLGLGCLYGCARLFGYLDQHPEMENYWLAGGIAFCVLAFLYITLKAYPMDYDANGVLLVDPQVLRIDAYTDVAMLCSFCAARYIEKRFIRFTHAGLSPKGIAVCAAGIVPLVLIAKVLKGPLCALLGLLAGKVLDYVLLVFYIIVLWPMVIRAVMKKQQ